MSIIKCNEYFDCIKGIMLGIDVRDDVVGGRVMLSTEHDCIHLTVEQALLIKQSLSERIVQARKMTQI
jgi:hypothetical protein